MGQWRSLSVQIIRFPRTNFSLSRYGTSPMKINFSQSPLHLLIFANLVFFTF